MHKGREEDASTGLHRTPRGHYDPGLLDYGHEQQHRNIVRLSEEDPSHGDRLPHFCHPHCGLDRNGRLRLHHRHVHVICPNLLLAAVPIDPSAVEAAAVVSDPGEYMDVGCHVGEVEGALSYEGEARLCRGLLSALVACCGEEDLDTLRPSLALRSCLMSASSSAA